MKKIKSFNNSFHAFYGTTMIGERGQAVIPKEARKSMSFKKREKLLVFGIANDMLVFLKTDHIEEIAKSLEEKLKIIKSIIKNSNTR